jgi:hypothetical protein
MVGERYDCNIQHPSYHYVKCGLLNLFYDAVQMWGGFRI